MLRLNGKFSQLQAKYLYPLFALLLISGGFLAVWQKYLRGDSVADIRQSMNNLLVIHRAIMDFQSEAYFGKIPTGLHELYLYRTTFYVEKNPINKEINEFSRVNKSYSLIPDIMAFRCPTKKHSKDEFSTDYTLLPWYKMFMPSNTVIAWDNPENFKSGGNLLFYDGAVRFYEMNKSEYKRFIEGIKSKSDREFLRAKCADMSLRGFSNIRKADDEEAQKILDQAAGRSKATK